MSELETLRRENEELKGRIKELVNNEITDLLAKARALTKAEEILTEMNYKTAAQGNKNAKEALMRRIAKLEGLAQVDVVQEKEPAKGKWKVKRKGEVEYFWRIVTENGWKEAEFDSEAAAIDHFGGSAPKGYSIVFVPDEPSKEEPVKGKWKIKSIHSGHFWVVAKGGLIVEAEFDSEDDARAYAGKNIEGTSCKFVFVPNKPPKEDPPKGKWKIKSVDSNHFWVTAKGGKIHEVEFYSEDDARAYADENIGRSDYKPVFVPNEPAKEYQI